MLNVENNSEPISVIEFEARSNFSIFTLVEVTGFGKYEIKFLDRSTDRMAARWLSSSDVIVEIRLDRKSNFSKCCN